ncbi:glycerophosphodiester phosphodiesterase family protein [Mycoavidus sp. B2-EB]|uniref:glycerophosphodiester phosphodiesterase family protein n=1 Tax=Mycoavidus sp. B2-EB TaxID=2651972 RepID=UPI0016295373|nr:glycerophosphodiester phosphodiesterase family protein [Mycoavidus sp. B2-EB]BBO60492.1 hydrolase [Mycoavidus sp. B2-EB]
MHLRFLRKCHVCFVFALTIFCLLAACSSELVTPSANAIALPQVVAHRGGAGDAPENTLEAIRLAVAHGADGMWLTVQLSKDGVPILYRPADLASLTNASGPVAHYTAAELARMNVGWNFKDENGHYPYCDRPIGIPTLRDALRTLPVGMPVVLDMKALPAEPQARAVAQVLSDENAWPHVLIYSTEAAYQQVFSSYPQAQLFESRDATRSRLIKILLNEDCKSVPFTSVWTGFELHRKLAVTENFTLGEGISQVNATMWTPATVTCFRHQNTSVKILAFSVNNALDYRTAACLGLDAVLSDSPRKMMAIKAELSYKPLQCDATAKKATVMH